MAGNRIWVSSRDFALADPALSGAYAAKYRDSRDRFRGPATVAADALSFTLGLVVRALFDPTVFPASRRIELLDHHLAGLAA